MLLAVLLFAACAGSPYRSEVRHWTRHDRRFAISDLEERINWHATYLSPEFRAALREKKAELLGWDEETIRKEEIRDLEEASQYDVFFVSVYAGSARWPEVGRNPSEWRLLLAVEQEEPAAVAALEKEKITHLHRLLYPYLDHWTEGFRARFPRAIEPGDSFRLIFPGVPARSELVWKGDGL